MRAACLGGTGEQQEDYWRSRHPGSGPPVLWVPGSPGCRRPPEELLHKRGQRGSGSRSPVAADNEASPGDELQAVTADRLLGRGRIQPRDPGGVSTGCPGADPGADPGAGR